MKFARLQVLAGLQKLAQEGKAQEVAVGAAQGWCCANTAVSPSL
jgi:hypothetical protein